MTALLSPVAAQGEFPLPRIVASTAAEACRPEATDAVSLGLQDALTDEERERHIASCGYLMLEAFRRYEQSGCFNDVGEAHRWRSLMEQAIKGRSAPQVASMEAAKGLAA